MLNPAEGTEQNTGTHRLWRFGHAELDERSLELKIRGEVAALEPKPLEVLLHLLHHAGEVVTKDELGEACWPRRILSDSVLTKTISRLREVLQDDDQAIIRTVHGYGYRLVAAVSVTASGGAPIEPALSFKPGDRLALRPHWLLVEQLGSGRSGEVWLARHDRTGEQRVYKFPLDVLSLGSLKREITLSRLLAETGRGRVVHLFDWNLEQEPYFLEYEHVGGGNLAQWTERNGGLLRLPLELRISLAVQMAETLAIAHSVGVLHKDLKPANVLVDEVEGSPRLKLADFGSGGVLDPARLEALGITRLGFTRTLAVADIISGTPLYLAPEMLAGQPATVHGDIYALGVMLYQLVVGDFRKPLAPGWELEVDDEMLRADIADAAAGDPQRRLGDAGLLAQRLRNLEARRREHVHQQEEQSRIDRERRTLERLQLRRKWMLVTIVSLVAGSVISLGLMLDAHRARNEAAGAAATSRAVAEFLSKDIFSAIGKVSRPPKEWTVIELLDSASAQIDERFASRPQVAAQLHAAMGGAYLSLDDMPSSERHLQRAYALAKSDEALLPLSLEVARKLVFHDYLAARLKDTIDDYAASLQSAERALGPAHPAVQHMRAGMAWAYAAQGNWSDSLRLQRTRAGIFAADPDADPAEYADAQRSFGAILVEAGQFDEAEKVLADAEARFDRLPDANEFTRMPVRIALTDLMIQRGRAEAALSMVDEAERVLQRWTPGQASSYAAVLRLFRARLFIERQQPLQALPLLQEMVAVPDPAEQNWAAWEQMAAAHLELGQFSAAERELRQALKAGIGVNGESHPWNLRIRATLALALLRQGRIQDSRQVLDQSDAKVAASLPDGHPILADWQRATGLTLAQEGRRADARAALENAQRIYQAQFGAGNWRVREISMELSALR